MAHSFILSRSSSGWLDARHYGALRVRLDAHDPVGPDLPTADVFVYKREPANHKTGEYADVFQNVASACDLAEYPVGAPTPGETEFPFFRKDFVELDFRSTRMAEEALDTIVASANELCYALDRLRLLTPDATYACGTPTESESA